MNQYHPQSRFATPPAVMNLLIINALIYMAWSIVPGASLWLTDNMALHFWAGGHFKPWQLVSYMFLHGGMNHIFFNMFALWMFGRTIEMNMGTNRFLTYYFATGIGAGLIQLAVNWAEFTYMGGPANATTLGASGAVFGILLAFGMMYPNSTIMLLIPPIPMKAKYFVIGYGLLELFFGVSGMGDVSVAHFAHVGGMIFGYLLLRIWKRQGKIYY